MAESFECLQLMPEVPISDPQPELLVDSKYFDCPQREKEEQKMIESDYFQFESENDFQESDRMFAHLESRNKQEQEKKLKENFKNKVLILVSIQLGIDRVSSEYFPVINELMNMKQFVGAVGGRPNFAYFFIGTLSNFSQASKAANKLIYLDPHLVQDKTCNLTKEYQETPQKFHCDHTRVMDMADLDPSLSFGYLIQSYEDFQQLEERIQILNLQRPDSQKVVISKQAQAPIIEKEWAMVQK